MSEKNNGDEHQTANNSVKLLIKASNQQFEDQIIESDLLWTVKRLKTQLALVYPSKPPVADQKLIYSGQLLNDKLQLKDVIRSYKDVYTQNHIFHLVYTPKNAPSPILTQKSAQNKKGSGVGATTTANNMSDTTDGLRQRHVAGNTNNSNNNNVQESNQQQQQQQQSPYFVHPQFIPQMLANGGNAGGITVAAGINTQHANQQCPTHNQNNVLPFNMPIGGQPYNMQAFATQQAAMYNWMQQVYSQYMNQYTQFCNVAGSATTSGAAAAAAASAGASAVNVAGTHPFLYQMQMPILPPNGTINVAGTTTNPVIPFPSATAATLAAQTQTQAQSQTAPLAVPAAATVAAVAAADQQQQQDEQQQQPQQQAAEPRFPNIVQEEQENRDWLDSFFSITRFAIFLTILYFNSSPLRCLIVFMIAGGIYLYHIGVIRLRNERNNNNINRNNNAAADQIRQGVQQVQQAQEQQQQQPIEGNDNSPNREADIEEIGEEQRLIDTNQQPNPAPVNNNNNNTEGTPAAGINADTENNENSTSVIAFVRTFVITFFTSLLPEAPAL